MNLNCLESLQAKTDVCGPLTLHVEEDGIALCVPLDVEADAHVDAGAGPLDVLQHQRVVADDDVVPDAVLQQPVLPGTEGA